MATGLLDIIHRAALDAADNAKFADLKYGNVVSENPLKVQLSSEFTIPESLLVVPQHLTNYTVPIEIEWTIGSTDGHTHEIESADMITIHNALRVGDRVALLRQKGGQSYFIIDRI